MTRWSTNRRRPLVAAALVAVALLGLVAWLVLGRTAEPPDPAVAEAQRRLAHADRVAAVSEAEIALASVSAELGEGVASSGGLAARVDAMGDELEDALADAPAGEEPSWDDLAAAFDSLESELRDDDPAAERSAAALADVLGRYGR